MPSNCACNGIKLLGYNLNRILAWHQTSTSRVPNWNKYNYNEMNLKQFARGKSIELQIQNDHVLWIILKILVCILLASSNRQPAHQFVKGLNILFIIRTSGMLIEAYKDSSSIAVRCSCSPQLAPIAHPLHRYKLIRSNLEINNKI